MGQMAEEHIPVAESQVPSQRTDKSREQSARASSGATRRESAAAPEGGGHGRPSRTQRESTSQANTPRSVSIAGPTGSPESPASQGAVCAADVKGTGSIPKEKES